MIAALTPLQVTGRDASHVVTHEGEGWRCQMHPEALSALLAMRAAALQEGLDIVTLSSFRDYERQANIWNAKFRGERPLLDRSGSPIDASGLSAPERVAAILWWSALPGASRHHWGSDCDVIDRAALRGAWHDYEPQLTSAEFLRSGVFGRLNTWLDAHIAEFGFFRPYASDREHGVRPEPWHLSFAPLSVPTLAAFNQVSLRAAIETGGIEGAAQVLDALPSIYADYVCGIDLPA